MLTVVSVSRHHPAEACLFAEVLVEDAKASVSKPPDSKIGPVVLGSSSDFILSFVPTDKTLHFFEFLCMVLWK